MYWQIKYNPLPPVNNAMTSYGWRQPKTGLSTFGIRFVKSGICMHFIILCVCSVPLLVNPLRSSIALCVPAYSTLARKWDPISVPCVSFQKLQNPFSKRPIFRQTSLCKFSKLQNPFSSPKLQTPVFKGYKTFSQVGQSPIFFSVVQTTHFLKDPFL